MPWTMDSPPRPAKGKSRAERKACVSAANNVLESTGDEGRAVAACIAAMKQVKKDMAFEFEVKVEKLDEESRLVFGFASVVEENGQLVTDLQDDQITPEELEKAVYSYVIDAREMGDEHVRMGVGQLVESMYFSKQKQEKLGIDLKKVGWWLGFYVSDDTVWKAFKDGTYKAFSIGGGAIREAA